MYWLKLFVYICLASLLLHPQLRKHPRTQTPPNQKQITLTPPDRCRASVIRHCVTGKGRGGDNKVPEDGWAGESWVPDPIICSSVDHHIHIWRIKTSHDLRFTPSHTCENCWKSFTGVRWAGVRGGRGGALQVTHN